MAFPAEQGVLNSNILVFFSMKMTNSVIKNHFLFLSENTIDVIKTDPFLPSGKDKYEMAKMIQLIVY
jgi:hypothetical protein